MMKKTAVLSAAICTVGLAGCMQTPASEPATTNSGGALAERLSGATLTNDRSTIVLGADGSMSGSVEGAWTERNGQFCRTLTAPARLAGTICQPVRFNDDGTVTFIGGAGGDVTYRIG